MTENRNIVEAYSRLSPDGVEIFELKVSQTQSFFKRLFMSAFEVHIVCCSYAHQNVLINHLRLAGFDLYQTGRRS